MNLGPGERRSMTETTGQAADVWLVCRDCGSPFAWTVREQAAFEDNGWTAPHRCLPCRATRRAQRAQEVNAEREAAVARGKALVCAVCRTKFRIGNGEVERYALRGWVLPRRCPDCRRRGLGLKVDANGRVGRGEQRMSISDRLHEATAAERLEAEIVMLERELQTATDARQVDAAGTLLALKRDALARLTDQAKA